MSSIIFKSNYIQFTSYIFPISTISSKKRLTASEIYEVRLNRFPPEIVTSDFEILFVPASDEGALSEFAQSNNIPITNPHDIWHDINRPFLDTEYTDNDHEASTFNLVCSGFKREEIKQIRLSVQKAMNQYNFGSMLWDWVHLGHWDVLCAFHLDKPRHLSIAEQYKLYFKFNDIALRPLTDNSAMRG